MTENEAIKKIKYMPVKLFDEEADKAKRMAIEALEEIQQYRAIGTVERFEQLSKQFAPHNVDETSCHLRQCNKCDMYRKENEKYHAIGTIEDFKALKEKSEPKKIKYEEYCGFSDPVCPECKKDIDSEDKYCRWCGQTLKS